MKIVYGISLIMILVLSAVTVFPPTNSASAQQFESVTMTYMPLIENDDHTIYVKVIADPSISPDKIQAVKNAITSKVYFIRDGKLFYEGWKGALLKASQQQTKFPIPTKIKFMDSSNGLVTVTISLTPSRSDHEYTGHTIFIETANMIKTSYVTIYNVDKLTAKSIATLTRHEFGHALGLGHSNDSGDLMNEKITTEYPYVSVCDINALTSLYDGNELNKVACHEELIKQISNKRTSEIFRD